MLLCVLVATRTTCTTSRERLAFAPALVGVCIAVCGWLRLPAGYYPPVMEHLAVCPLNRLSLRLSNTGVTASTVTSLQLEGARTGASGPLLK